MRKGRLGILHKKIPKTPAFFIHYSQGDSRVVVWLRCTNRPLIFVHFSQIEKSFQKPLDKFSAMCYNESVQGKTPLKR